MNIVCINIVIGGLEMSENKNLFCNEKHNKMERFMEICLLCLLHEETGHGYGLIEKLSIFGFTEETMNISTLYRTLRKMENEELVSSIWEQSEQGPKRRVYNITDNGKKELKNWISVLKNRKARIEKLINRYESIN